MLDKSLPYFNVIMKRAAGQIQPPAVLSEGYTFRLFESGGERNWAKIVVSVGEFDEMDDALRYFDTTYGRHVDELKQRLCFVHDDHDNPVGTVTSWWNSKENESPCYRALSQTGLPFCRRREFRGLSE